MTEGKLSCWNKRCPYYLEEACFREDVVEAKGCRNWEDAPWNLEMNKQ